MVVAETFGLPLDAVTVNIGSSSYPNSGPSGGSTTIGGVSESNRRASQGGLSALFGARTVELDRLVKTLDIYGLASKSLQFPLPNS